MAAFSRASVFPTLAAGLGGRAWRIHVRSRRVLDDQERAGRTFDGFKDTAPTRQGAEGAEKLFRQDNQVNVACCCGPPYLLWGVAEFGGQPHIQAALPHLPHQAKKCRPGRIGVSRS
jgi:hypothetical protein